MAIIESTEEEEEEEEEDEFAKEGFIMVLNTLKQPLIID